MAGLFRVVHAGVQGGGGGEMRVVADVRQLKNGSAFLNVESPDGGIMVWGFASEAIKSVTAFFVGENGHFFLCTFESEEYLNDWRTLNPQYQEIWFK
jgi:hypothetical protein